MKVQADIVGGIYEVLEFDEGMKPMKYTLFRACLDDQEVSDIACELTPEEAEIIDSEYGINKFYTANIRVD